MVTEYSKMEEIVENCLGDYSISCGDTPEYITRELRAIFPDATDDWEQFERVLKRLYF